MMKMMKVKPRSRSPSPLPDLNDLPKSIMKRSKSVVIDSNELRGAYHGDENVEDLLQNEEEYMRYFEATTGINAPKVSPFS